MKCLRGPPWKRCCGHASPRRWPFRKLVLRSRSNPTAESRNRKHTMLGSNKSALTEERVREVLKQVKFPGFSRDIISFGLVKSVAITAGNDVTVGIEVTTRDAGVPGQIEGDIKAALSAGAGVGQVAVQLK